MTTEAWSLWWLVPMLVSLGCLVFVILVYRSASQLAMRADHKIQQLEKQVSIATQGAIGMGQRLLVLENKLRSVQVKQDELDSVGGSDQFAYSQAMQMFNQGADIDTVAASCGFSNSEAELMALVQKQLSKNVQTPHDADV